MALLSKTFEIAPVGVSSRFVINFVTCFDGSIIDDATQSELKLLSQDERVTEIAQMLSGAKISDSALNHAKELLN